MDAVQIGFAAFLLTTLLISLGKSDSKNDFLVVTVATDETDGFKRFMRSVKKYGLNAKVLGLGKEWVGGDVAHFSGGGQKVNLLREGLAEFRDRDDLILMFVDSYDLIFTDGVDTILERFNKFDARVVFSAEGFCWPDNNLREHYPEVKANEKRYLNSGGFMGYAKDLYEIISHTPIKHDDDDQLYYTNIFLDPKLREKWNMKLDTKSEIFINLNGALGDIKVKFRGPNSYLYNLKTGTTPIIVHGNGPIKAEFNRLANYLADGWTTTAGCLSCQEDTISLEGLKEEDYPTILLGIFVEQPTPFLMEFFERVGNLSYPKNKIDVYLHYVVEHHEDDVDEFLKNTQDKYRSVRVASPVDNMDEKAARTRAVEECMKKNCQYYLSLDSIAQMTNRDTLKMLIEQNRTVISPMLARPEKLWSNFWAAINKQGYYARSEDYIELVERKRMGLWNVPFMSLAYLIQGHILPEIRDAFEKYKDLDADMSFCQKLREKGIFMFVSNQHLYGHLVNPEDFDIRLPSPDMYQIFSNPVDWEYRYIHENYSKSLEEDSVIANPCPDVYWFPIVTTRFCKDLIEVMNTYGAWSTGANKDPRLAGGYENVPTIDIHMNQVGLEPHWLWFIKKYVSPLQQRVFTGYYHDPPHSVMNFVVRYKPDEQPLLRPHHDASTFTINIALNRKGIDFEGGGCRFLRYNCSVQDTKMGWMLMHPGRLTHFHEGLRVTKGTRYIMISFVDP